MLTEKRWTSARRVYASGDRLPTDVDRVLSSPTLFALLGVMLLVAPVALGALAWRLFGEPIKAFLSSQFWFSILIMALILFIILHLCAALILAERKLSAFIQDRYGPNRVGFWGILQPIVDGLKFILKEDIIPAKVDRPIYLLAPAAAFVVALSTFIVIPWAGEIVWPWQDAAGNAVRVTTQGAVLDIGLLYILAVGSLSVYGVVLAGWASNNKYAFYGAMRAAAQMLSYEIPLGLGVLVVMLVAASVRPEVIVNEQAATGVWNVFLHPIAFMLVFITALAETNRAPFDLAECEQELVAGYHTEYSGMKFALFFLAEYAHMTVASAIITLLFLGGWAPLPFSSWYSYGADGYAAITWWNTGWIAALIKFGVFWGKISLLIGLFMLVRWTIPRFRFDQLMRLAWKGMIPAGMVLVIGAGLMAALGLTPRSDQSVAHNTMSVVAHLVLNAVILAGMLYAMKRSTQVVTGRQETLPEIRVRPTAM